MLSLIKSKVAIKKFNKNNKQKQSIGNNNKKPNNNKNKFH